MKNLTLERSIWIAAPRHQVWQAVTNPDQIIQWFAPNLAGMGEMKHDERGCIVVQLGPMSIDFAAMESAVEPQQVTMRTLPDRLITTTYLLNDVNGGTDVTVRVAGFELLRDAVQDDRLHLSAAGWEKTLHNLRAFVAGSELPHPHAFISPLFGYWRETKTTLASERSIWIAAPRERVWRAITDPAQVQLWYSPAIPWELSALEVGGRLTAKTDEPYVEIIELLDPPHQFATRTVAESSNGVVKGKMYTLTEENGGTRLTLTLSGYEQDPEATRWTGMEQDTFGFGMMLQNVKASVEGTEVPFPFGF